MLASLELEIKNLLTQEESLEKVIGKIVDTVELEGDGMSVDHVETLCRFLLNVRAERALIQFVRKNWNRPSFEIPWPYFLLALQRFLTKDIAKVLWKGIYETKGQIPASRCRVLDPYIYEIKEVREGRKHRLRSDLQFQRQELIDNLNTLRVQQLYQQERKLLDRLVRMYPGDSQILRELADFKERNALETINRVAPLRNSTFLDADLLNPEIERAKDSWGRAFTEKAVAHPEISYDFAVAAFMMEIYETAIKILEMAEPSPSKTWFRLELLLKARRFLDLLQELAQIEVQYSNDPETFFATTYLRAQAFWGLGQKHLAIETMETLLTTRPQYRMGPSLLSQWRQR